jgi:hypothetical protein
MPDVPRERKMVKGVFEAALKLEFIRRITDFLKLFPSFRQVRINDCPIKSRHF